MVQGMFSALAALMVYDYSVFILYKETSLTERFQNALPNRQIIHVSIQNQTQFESQQKKMVIHAYTGCVGIHQPAHARNMIMAFSVRLSILR